MRKESNGGNCDVIYVLLTSNGDINNKSYKRQLARELTSVHRFLSS